MRQEELWDKLDTAVLMPDRKKAKETVAALLHQAYTEGLCLVCAGTLDPKNPRLCRKAYLDIGNRRYFTLFTQYRHMDAFEAPEFDMRIFEIRCKDILDDVLNRKDIHGITFNPVNTATDARVGFIMRKSDLPKPTEYPPAPTP